MIDGVMDALDYLVEKGRINSKEYWLKALDTTNNVNYMIVKWADDVATMENEGLLRIVKKATHEDGFKTIFRSEPYKNIP